MRLPTSFFQQDVLEVAPALLGKKLIRTFDDGFLKSYYITETEAYRGPEDLACHASKGRTPRTEVMFHDGGKVYVYLIYGMYWMLNFVTGKKDEPQAVLIRGITDFDGPGKLGRELKLDKTFYGNDIWSSSRLYVEEGLSEVQYSTSPRIGIDYAGEVWKNKP